MLETGVEMGGLQRVSPSEVDIGEDLVHRIPDDPSS